MWDFIQKCEILFGYVRFYCLMLSTIVRNESYWYNIIHITSGIAQTMTTHEAHRCWRRQKVILCEILFKNVRFYSYFRRFWVAKYTIGDQKLVPCDHKYIFGAPACVLDSKTKFRFFSCEILFIFLGQIYICEILM